MCGLHFNTSYNFLSLLGLRVFPLCPMLLVLQHYYRYYCTCIARRQQSTAKSEFWGKYKTFYARNCFEIKQYCCRTVRSVYYCGSFNLTEEKMLDFIRSVLYY